jgi:hypothetical protein
MLIAMAGALWVALVASIAALVAAIGSPLSTWLVAKSQRQSDEESRVYQDKVAAYLAVASDAYLGRNWVAECAEQLAKPGTNDASAKELVDKLDTDIDELNEREPEMLARISIIAARASLKARRDLVAASNEATNELFYDLAEPLQVSRGRRLRSPRRRKSSSFPRPRTFGSLCATTSRADPITSASARQRLRERLGRLAQ